MPKKHRLSGRQPRPRRRGLGAFNLARRAVQAGLETEIFLTVQRTPILWLVADYTFPVIVERDEDGWFVAECPVLDGCYTQGETEEEALELILDAIRLHVEERLANGLPIPQAVGMSTVRIAV